MRRLVSKEDLEKKRKRNQIVVGLILVFLMFASTLGYAIQGGLGSQPTSSGFENVTYNGFKFSYINGFWVFENFVFKYKPQETPDIGSGLKGIDNYENKPLYVQSDDSSSEVEIYVNLGQRSEVVQEACLEGSSCAEGVPTKTCSDNFIIIKESEQERIEQSENCVYIEGKKEDLLRLTDQFLFKVLGIK